MANPWIVIYIFVILLRHVFQGETRQGKTYIFKPMNNSNHVGLIKRLSLERTRV